jgi:hypothetical protein
MRKHTLIALAAEVLNLAELSRVETPVTTYELTMTPHLEDIAINIPNKKNERTYSTNPRHSKPKKGKGR